MTAAIPGANVREHTRRIQRSFLPGALILALFLVGACSVATEPVSQGGRAIPTVTSKPDKLAPTPDQPRDTPYPLYLQGINLLFDRYSLEQGLSQSVAQVLLQDHRGFIWIGTEDGLNRFDGYEFTVYRNDPDSLNSLSNNTISSLDEGKGATLWVGTFGGGLNWFDPETERWTHYRHDPADPNSLSNDYVLSVYQDRSGVVWVGTRGSGLDRLEPETGQWHHYRHDPQDPQSLSNDYVNAILEDSSGVLWVATVEGLNRFHPEYGQWRHYLHDPDDARSLSASGVCRLYEDRAGDLWVSACNGGLNKFEPETDTFVRYQHDPEDANSLGSDDVGPVAQDLSGCLWVGTSAGLDRFVPETEQWYHYRNNPSDPRSLSGNMVVALLEDQAGGLWIGTYGEGLNRLDGQREQFAHYRSIADDPNSLSDNLAWAVYEDRTGVLWIGTHRGGLDALDRETGQWRHYQHDPQDRHSLSSNSVRAMLEDRQGTLWIATDSGLDRLDRDTDRFTHFRQDPDDPNSWASNMVWTVLEDPEGVLWLGTSHGLSRFDPDTKQFTRYPHDPDDPQSLSNNRAWALYQDREGVLWIGTLDGLNKLEWDEAADLDPERARFVRYRHDPDDPQSLSHNGILSIYEDSSGVMWIGTWGGGLNKFNTDGEIFTRYRVKDGLPNDTVYGILEDDEGYLWLSTNNGISKFDPQTEIFKNYGVGDGLQSAEFNLNAYYESPGGEMFFGGINGVNALYPNGLRQNPYVPPIVLTSITQGGQVLNLGKAAFATTEVTFEWPDNDFEFEFAALNFYQPESNQYAYMLQGYDDDWHYVGTRRFGAYTNLPGGTYTLRLKGSNNDGVWNEEGLSIRTTIVPPFWSTWWFRGLIVMVVAVGAVAGIRLRIRRTEAREHELESQVAHRTKELAALNAVAGVVSRSLDLQQILSDALDKTLEVTELEAGGIYLLQEDMSDGEAGLLRIAAHKGLSAEFVAGVDNLLVGEGFSGRVLQTGEPLVVRDLPADPRLTRSVVAESGFRSVAVAPVVSRAKVLGTLFVVTREDREFSQSDLALLASIGGQIGVAIENARFFEAEQRRAEQFRVIAEVGRRTALILDIDEVLGQVVGLLQQTFGYYHVAIGLVEGDEVIYRVGAGRLWGEEPFGGYPARLKIGSEGLSGWVAATGKPLLVPDVSQEPRYVWMQPSDTRSELVVPILIKGEVIGILDTQSDQLNAFDETDLAVLQSLAHQIGAAIENARLYEQAQQAAVVEERSRLARELHDAVTQTLFSASLIAGALPTSWELDPDEGQQLAKDLQQLTRGALAEMRTLLLELRPTALIDTSLVDLLHQLAEAATGRTGVPVACTVEGDCVLPPDVHVTFYRIAQEALNNVVKHAHPNRVKLHLRSIAPSPSQSMSSPGEMEEPQSRARKHGRRVELRIRDDGRGFDPGDISPDHLGLGIMRERAQAIGATLTIESEPGVGTQVAAVWEEGGSTA